jgi:cysteinyl-tRNA synthetase
MKLYTALILSLISGSLYNSCGSSEQTDEVAVDNYYYRDEMRQFVQGISQYAKKKDTSFFIIPQNGIELIVKGESADSELAVEYLKAVDAHGQEDLFYGYDEDNTTTPADATSYISDFLTISKNQGKTILVTDYVFTPSKMSQSYTSNKQAGYISFAADHRDLNTIPDFPSPIFNENSDNVENMQQVQNFLYLINPESFSSKNEFIQALSATNYDLLLIDLFFTDENTFSVAEINQLKMKANGGKRLVISYMSIGEAENYRYYWKEEWASNPPSWLDAENPDWEGNYKVRYWDSAWQDIIFGTDSSYLNKVINAGFDGVYLDIIDAFEYYE